MDSRLSVARWVVVIPAYQHPDDTIACLESLHSATPAPGTIVVVDDGSPDDSVRILEEWAERSGQPLTVERDCDHPSGQPLRPGLTIIAAEKNEGFNRSCNRGLVAFRDRSAAPFVLLLNNDAVVTPSFFGELARAVAAHPRAGLLTGTIYEWDRSTVWYAGGKIHYLRGLASSETVARIGRAPYATEWVSGCAMLVAREALERVGLLPACFSPVYSEDVDYSFHVRSAGFELIVAPRAVAYHRVGQSLGQHGSQRPQVIYISNRNRAFVVRRNYRGWRRVVALGYLAVTKPLRAGFEAVRGRPRRGWAVLAGTVDGVFNPAARE